MTDKPTDEIERRAREYARETCRNNPSMKFDNASIRTGYRAGVKFGHSAAKEEVEGLRRQVENLEFALDQTHREKDALKKENAELIFGAAEKINALKTAQGELVEALDKIDERAFETGMVSICEIARPLLERLRKDQP